MNATERLAAAKAARQSADSAFFDRLDQVKADVAAHGVGGRIAERVSDGAREAFAEAAELAEDNRGLIAATIAAVALYLMRHPIMAWISRRCADGQAEEGETDDDHAQAG